MRTVHHRRFLLHRLFEYFDPTGKAAESLAERVLIAEQRARVGGAEDDGALVRAAVVVIEGAAAEDGDAEGTEVVRGHGAPDDDTGCAWIEGTLAFDQRGEDRLRTAVYLLPWLAPSADASDVITIEAEPLKSTFESTLQNLRHVVRTRPRIAAAGK